MDDEGSVLVFVTTGPETPQRCATPFYMANMAAVTQRFGASHMAFIVVPLVCAFFIDLANALLIPFFLANF